MKSNRDLQIFQYLQLTYILYKIYFNFAFIYLEYSYYRKIYRHFTDHHQMGRNFHLLFCKLKLKKQLPILFYFSETIVYYFDQNNIFLNPKAMNCLIFSFLLLLITTNSTLIYVQGVPVDNFSLLRAQVALNRWETTLNRTYRQPFQNRVTISTQTNQVNTQLNNINQQLSRYNNVIVGGGNAVSGTKNLIIGTRNGLIGSNNYVFTSNFNNQVQGKEPLNNSLVSDQWIAQLDKRSQIIANLYNVIYPNN